MPINPAVPGSTDPTQRLLERVAALERTVRDLSALTNGGASSAIPVVASLPAAGRKGRVVYNAADDKVYKDTGAAWVNPL